MNRASESANVVEVLTGGSVTSSNYQDGSKDNKKIKLDNGACHENRSIRPFYLWKPNTQVVSTDLIVNDLFSLPLDIPHVTFIRSQDKSTVRISREDDGIYSFETNLSTHRKDRKEYTILTTIDIFSNEHGDVGECKGCVQLIFHCNSYFNDDLSVSIQHETELPSEFLKNSAKDMNYYKRFQIKTYFFVLNYKNVQFALSMSFYNGNYLTLKFQNNDADGFLDLRFIEKCKNFLFSYYKFQHEYCRKDCHRVLQLFVSGPEYTEFKKNSEIYKNTDPAIVSSLENMKLVVPRKSEDKSQTDIVARTDDNNTVENRFHDDFVKFLAMDGLNQLKIPLTPNDSIKQFCARFVNEHEIDRYTLEKNYGIGKPTSNSVIIVSPNIKTKLSKQNNNNNDDGNDLDSQREVVTIVNSENDVDDSQREVVTIVNSEDDGGDDGKGDVDPINATVLTTTGEMTETLVDDTTSSTIIIDDDDENA